MPKTSLEGSLQPPAGEQVAGLLLRDPDLKSVLGTPTHRRQRSGRRRALSDRALRLPGSPVHPAAQPDAVRGAAEDAHTILAYLFFLTFLGHFAAILFHTLVLRDGILKRMVPWHVP